MSNDRNAASSSALATFHRRLTWRPSCAAWWAGAIAGVAGSIAHATIRRSLAVAGTWCVATGAGGEGPGAFILFILWSRAHKKWAGVDGSGDGRLRAARGRTPKFCSRVPSMSASFVSAPSPAAESSTVADLNPLLLDAKNIYVNQLAEALGPYILRTMEALWDETVEAGSSLSTLSTLSTLPTLPPPKTASHWPGLRNALKSTTKGAVDSRRQDLGARGRAACSARGSGGRRRRPLAHPFPAQWGGPPVPTPSSSIIL